MCNLLEQKKIQNSCHAGNENDQVVKGAILGITGKEKVIREESAQVP